MCFGGEGHRKDKLIQTVCGQDYYYKAQKYSLGLVDYGDIKIMLPKEPKASGLTYCRDYQSVRGIEAINKRGTGNRGISSFRDEANLRLGGRQ